MAYTPQSNQYDDTPNGVDLSNTLFAGAQTSIDGSLFGSENAHLGGEMGVGSLKKRSVDELLVTYEPYSTVMNTFIMLSGGMETVSNAVHEWFEDDAILPYNSTASTGGNTSADGNATADVITVADGSIFRPNMLIRYVDSTGDWTYALVTAVSGNDVTLFSVDGANLPAPTNGGAFEVMSTAYDPEFDHDFNPRGANPKGYQTYLQSLESHGGYTLRSGAEDTYVIDQISRAQDQAMRDMNFQLERQALYGIKALVTTPAMGSEVNRVQKLYTSEGVYDVTANNNYHTSDFFTGSVFDADKFKNALYDYIDYNFGAESGAPPLRQGFHDARFGSYLSRAFEDKQRFYGTEFAAGVKVSTFEANNGTIEFVNTPLFQMQHPIPNGSLRGGSAPKGVLLTLPVADCLTRLEFNGEQLRDDVFAKRNGGKEFIYRLQYTTGLKFTLRQYASVLEEVAES